MTWTVIERDCVEAMAAMPEGSVDAVVCDPPYGLEFMGQEWDRPWAVSARQGGGFQGRKENLTLPAYRDGRNANCRACGGRARGVNRCQCLVPRAPAQDMRDFQAWCEVWAREAVRVLKPGGHLLAFGGTRTYHRLACAIEDAGFEIRDSIAWMYGSGFPKSLDVSKAIDRAAGADREVVGRKVAPQYRYASRKGYAKFSEQAKGYDDGTTLGKWTDAGVMDTAPATPEAERWQGWGTALKPSHEPVVVARKPLSGTVAETVLRYGTGALNVDATRIRDDASSIPACNGAGSTAGTSPSHTVDRRNHSPRIPHQETSASQHGSHGRLRPNGCECDPLETPPLGSLGGCPACRRSGGEPSHLRSANGLAAAPPLGDVPESLALDGAESDSPLSQSTALDNYIGRWPANVVTDEWVRSQLGVRWFYCAKSSTSERSAGLDGDRNIHPTCKPIELMRWLVRLVTPPGGRVLDPFAGSGTTGIACVLEGFQFVGCEREAEYAEIARARIAWWERHPKGVEIVKALEAERARRNVEAAGQVSLFDMPPAKGGL